MNLSVPIQPSPNQTLAVTLAAQTCQIALSTIGDDLYFDLLVSGAYIVRTRICRDRQRLLLDAQYKGFQGDFSFIDTQGLSDPFYAGLGTRFLLIYISAGA